MGRKERSWIDNWLFCYQAFVNKVVGGNYVQFTTRVWQSKSQTGPTEEGNGYVLDKIKEKVKVIEEDKCPFWDTKMAWEAKEFIFSIYQKKDQKLKYVDSSSNHHPTTFTSIATGVGKRFARLTSRSVSKGKKGLDQIYSDHADVLKKEDLALEEFPTLDKSGRRMIKLAQLKRPPKRNI
eukprot:5108334-Ditylum_brightwellii.AAC.1